MTRYKGIIVAGTFSELAIITLLALGFGSLRAVADSGTTIPREESQLPLPETTNLTVEEALQAWQQYSVELEQTVRTMQDRENTYQSQMDLANQTILLLQDQANTAGGSASAGPAFFDDDNDEHHGEHEGSQEFEEHEVNDD
jgi:hypothetical protein